MAKPTLAELLPKSANHLMALLGKQDATHLISTYGGTPVRVPTKAHEHHALLDVISLDSLQALVKDYGGTVLDVPRCPKLKHLMVFELRDHERKTFSEIARMLNYTDAYVRIIYHGYRQKPDHESQASLF